MEAYDDILTHARVTAPSPMPRESRAAQFAPFAALVGLEGALDETARLTDRRVPLSDEEQAALNEMVCRLQEHIAERPTVTLLCFEEDAAKEGGRYVTVTGRLRVIDTVLGEWIFEDRRRIPFAAVCGVTTAGFDK